MNLRDKETKKLTGINNFKQKKNLNHNMYNCIKSFDVKLLEIKSKF